MRSAFYKNVWIATHNIDKSGRMRNPICSVKYKFVCKWRMSNPICSVKHKFVCHLHKNILLSSVLWWNVSLLHKNVCFHAIYRKMCVHLTFCAFYIKMYAPHTKIFLNYTQIFCAFYRKMYVPHTKIFLLRYTHSIFVHLHIVYSSHLIFYWRHTSKTRFSVLFRYIA